MDTHFEQHLPHSPARPELSLPGEDEQISVLQAEPNDQLGAAHASGVAAADEAKPAQDVAIQPTSEPDAIAAGPVGRPASRRRSSLMTGAAIGITLVAAAGVFLISPYNHVIPVNLAAFVGNPLVQPGATQHIAIPAPIAPAASLARAPAPHPTPAPNRPAVVSQPRADDMQEIVALRPAGSTQEAPAADLLVEDRRAAAPGAAPAPAATVEAPTAQPSATAPPPPAQVVTQAPVVQPTSASNPSRAIVTAPSPTDPVMVAATLQAAPMSTPQQVDVLNVVTELGTLLRNQRAENAQLREDVQQMRERLDTQLNDYARRLALAEARGAVSAAMGAGAPTATPPATVTPAPVTVAASVPPVVAGGTRGIRNVAVVPAALPAPAATQEAARRYRVQAASPGLAMLAEVDRTGDAGNLLQVSIGDDVPGYGKVKSIAQQGVAWVLTAERGTIR